MIGIMIAILSGVLMSVQGVFNTDVTEHSSLWVANSWVQVTALAVCLAFWGITDCSSLRFCLIFARDMCCLAV